MEQAPADLVKLLCSIWDHDWPPTVSGQAGRPCCGRCGLDYMDWVCDAILDDEDHTVTTNRELRVKEALRKVKRELGEKNV